MVTSPSPRILLASLSPRRRRLLTWLGFEYEVTHVDTPEILDSPLARNPATLACALATEKADAAALDHADALILCFDTIVVHEGVVLGKPTDTPDAWRMLRSLSGRKHEVVTGCAIRCPDVPTPTTFSVTTAVQMQDLDDVRIAEWMARGEYLGCAGAYNIEGQVAAVGEDQCYQNVAGLPLCHLHAVLGELLPGACRPHNLATPIAACDAALGRTCRLGPGIIAR